MSAGIVLQYVSIAINLAATAFMVIGASSDSDWLVQVGKWCAPVGISIGAIGLLCATF